MPEGSALTMNTDVETSGPEPSQVEVDNARSFQRLKWAYSAALIVLAVLSITTRLVVERERMQHADDAQLIDMAGRQRMLSQRIAKNLLLLETSALGSPAQGGGNPSGLSRRRCTSASHAACRDSASSSVSLSIRIRSAGGIQ